MKNHTQNKENKAEMNGNTLTMNFQGTNQSNNVQDLCYLLTNTLSKWSLILHRKSITKYVIDIYQFLL